LATSSESDKLYVKIELSRAEKCSYRTELQPIFREGINFVARTYDLPTLMAGKISALLSRTWFKGKRSEITVKGRDYYDLIWFMEKKIEPRYECIGDMKISPREVWREIKERVERLNPKDLEYDLSNLIENPGFVRSFSQNYKNLFFELLERSQVWS
ncbi:MAG: nucleotidyl transferase AbiEii/AbiGii toxin family protein, partial [candidate division WOR-3 bacterium]|nr:nucleotidyl transferase AbiEii/AbiGii toxin family protein [candidate division WOR-3 bacterium]